MRVTAATNKNLEVCIKEEIFREELYYRFKVTPIRTPFLREAPEDITGFGNYLLNTYRRTMQTDLKQFIPAAFQSLLSYIWPSNARQWENEIKRLAASVRGKSITEDHLDASIRNLEARTRNLQTHEEPAP